MDAKQNLNKSIKLLQAAMEEAEVNPCDGLPYDLFLFSTTLFPFINVDLFVENNNRQLLLSWRDDEYYGAGWQIPGGIIRMKETIEERIHKTACSELGCDICGFDRNPIAVGENIVHIHRDGLNNQLERAHNIALLYKCFLPDDYVIDNSGITEYQNGFLKWFDSIPDNILECHLKAYGDTLIRWEKGMI
jgi:ADP-ribose pyrophosphatase YjhB (NUDIX family)